MSPGLKNHRKKGREIEVTFKKLDIISQDMVCNNVHNIIMRFQVFTRICGESVNLDDDALQSFFDWKGLKKAWYT